MHQSKNASAMRKNQQLGNEAAKPDNVLRVLVGTLIVLFVAITMLGAGIAFGGSAQAGNQNLKPLESEMAFETVNDVAMSEKEIAEQKAAEEAARIAEEQRIEAEKAAQQAAAEEAERKAREAAAKTISDTPGEGDYSDVLMIGDSIMVVSSWSLKSYLPGVEIDACSARSLEYGGVAEGGGAYDGVLDHVRALDPSQYARYVIGTGNNDGYGMDLESGEEIVSLLGNHEIWFVTEYVTNNSAGTANTNSTIDELCSRYPNVHKIDWYSVASENRAEYLGSDNCHPQTQAATNAYAGLVKSALDF